jgi:hypothetical protein
MILLKINPPCFSETDYPIVCNPLPILFILFLSLSPNNKARRTIFLNYHLTSESLIFFRSRVIPRVRSSLERERL